MRRLATSLATLTLVASVVFLQSCSSDNVADTNRPSSSPLNGANASSSNTSSGSNASSSNASVTEQALIEKVGAEYAYEALYGSTKSSVKQGESVQAAITYAGLLCEGVAFTGTARRLSFINSSRWTYYKFYATAGATVAISVKRTGCGMDPGFAVFKDTTNDNTGVSIGSGGVNMTLISWHDDGVTPALGCGCFFDPTASIAIQTTGWYTVAVFDVVGCGTGITFEVSATGVSCDSDGDGIYDWNDANPYSDMSATINFDGCDSGVENHLFADGTTMMDLLNACASSATTHGDFVSCCSDLTNAWKSAGHVSGQQKGAIQNCASNAAIP